MTPEQILALVKEKWIASWREYSAKHPGALSPETMVGQQSYCIEQTVKFTLESLPNLSPDRLKLEC